jgi:uncharacterized protein (DUF302 family)
MAEQQPIINLEWMDEEVRRYRTELMAAQQRIDSQDEELRDQARHIEDLEGRLAGVLTQLNRLAVLERALDQYKEEIRLLVEQQEETHREERREDARIKLIEQDNLSRALNDVRKGLTVLTRLEEELELRAAEDRRLNEVVLALRTRVMDQDKRLDLGLRPISFLQEQRTRDSKNLAQVQEQAASLLKNLDNLSNRFLVVEEITTRNRQSVEDLVNIRAELQQQQRRFLEEMQMAEQERQRTAKEWGELEESREQRMHEFGEQMRLYAQEYTRIRSTMANLEALGERLQREQHEVAELQRLTEERLRTKMDEWEAQAEKRWQREKLLWDQQWRDHDRRDDEVQERLSLVDERSKINEEQITHLWDVFTEDMRQQMQSVQNRMIRTSEHIETHRGRKISNE